MNQQAIVAEFRRLSPDEQGDLIDALWDEYRKAEEARNFTQDEIAELDRRMAEYRADPSTAVDSEEVFREMRELLGASK